MPLAAERELEDLRRTLTAVGDRKLVGLGAFAPDTAGKRRGCLDRRKDALEASG